MRKKTFLQEGSSINTRIERPPFEPINSEKEDFDFFCIDVDNYIEKAPRYLPIEQGRDLSIFRLYGVTEAGNSVVVHAFNFKSYFYIQIPNSMEIDNSHMDDVMKYLNSKLATQGVEMCQFVLSRSIMHFADKPTRFIKVTCTLPKHVG